MKTRRQNDELEKWQKNQIRTHTRNKKKEAGIKWVKPSNTVGSCGAALISVNWKSFQLNSKLQNGAKKFKV